MRFLPYGRQVIEEDDIAAVVRALSGDWLTTGPAVGDFERKFKSAVDAPYAVSCANGTAALHLAAMALRIGPGDRVIVPAVTFLATANAVRFTGGDVIFADVDPDTGLLTPETLTAAISVASNQRVRAAFTVHLNGQCCDSAAIAKVAKTEGLAIVEDACHALGTTYESVDDKAVRIGACRHSDMATFSFHPVKTIAIGEGGAVTTRNAELAERLERLRNHGMHRNADEFANTALAFAPDGKANPWYYEMSEIGYNYRVSDINCALGTSQLNKLPRFIEKRKSLAALYDQLLQPLAPVLRPVAHAPRCDPVLHLYVVLIDFQRLGCTRADFMNALKAKGVGTQVHYLPLNKQPYYRRLYGDITLPGAEAYYERCLSLPLQPNMNADDAAYVVDTLSELIAPLTLSKKLQ